DQSRTIAPDGAIVEIQGAAEGCDLLMLMFKNQKIAAYGSSYISGFSRKFPTAFEGCPSEVPWIGFGCR
ncbi:hypothetical protein, partial [Pseudomonas baetica]|uniref:hypothetical protein n=1 Tax=Pseudomonas baetica TaxID=674054 RepID=UPI002870BC5C